jgi:hypothetical protein
MRVLPVDQPPMDGDPQPMNGCSGACGSNSRARKGCIGMG